MTIEQKSLAEMHAVLSQLTHRFFWYLDEFRYQDLVDTMEPEARWHRQGKVLRGREEALAALEVRSRTQKIRHVMTNLQITSLSADEASTVGYMTVYKHDDGADAPLPRTIGGPSGFLLVRTSFRRHGDQWLISEQAATPEFVCS